MTLNKLQELHRQVVHVSPQKYVDEYAKQVAFYAKENGIKANNYRALEKLALRVEEKEIKKYPYDLLKYVCSDCFADVEPSVMQST